MAVLERYNSTSDFHNSELSRFIGDGLRYNWGTEFDYSFETFFHPFVGELIANLNRGSVKTMLDPQFLASLKRQYQPFYYKVVGASSDSNDIVSVSMDDGTIDTSIGGPYAGYNWELFYHIPVMIAVHLSQNQRFAEAEDWFHLVFDPTFLDQNGGASYPFWKFIGFRQPNLVENLVDILSYSGSDAAKLGLKASVMKGYDAILTTPFDPHAVARSRPMAYMYYVVMKYLDNLIARGDKLFGGGKPQDVQQPTIETINEATLCYVLAANILGPRPQQLTPRGTAQPQTYLSLKAKGMDHMGNALVDLEVQFPFNMTQGTASGSGDVSGPLFGIGQTLYFCIPPNKKLLAYWDVVEDRLFKIRNCENIQGTRIKLPLFDPPRDPGMLVQAAAAGIDVEGAISGSNQPVGPLRALTSIQKALELVSEVRSFGSLLQAALEKGDAEHLAALRQTHEVSLQHSMQNVRFTQWKQAQESTQTLLRTRQSTLERYKFYLSLLDQPVNATNVPETFNTAGVPTLNEDNFADVYQNLVGQFDLAVAPQDYPSLQLAGSNSPSASSGASSIGQLFLNSNEDNELNKLLTDMRDIHEAAGVALAAAGVLTLIPDLDVNLEFWGLGATSNIFGGNKLSDLTKVGASVMNIVSGHHQDQAGLAARTAAHQRRVSEWTVQANGAARELMQMGRQLIGSVIAEHSAYHDYQSVKNQVEQSQSVQDYMETKFTSENRYQWMQGQLSGSYYQYYRFAHDTARQAEQTVKVQLMRPELSATTFIGPNYWDGSNQGLLAGEALHLDLKRLEMAYHSSNTRELELTRHVSLRQLDPIALLALRATGTCSFTIPEWFFDRDCPGQYMRRIKSIALSLPSVVGPYGSVNCKLTQQNSSIRVSSLLANNKYGRTGVDDSRFLDMFGSTDTIVTSSGSNDSGMFETNLQEDRFLPFEETAAANSTWTLALPQDFPAFDYSTLTDAILHVRYTARDGGEQLAATCSTELAHALKVGTYELDMLFLLRNDFPTEWAAFTNAAPGTSFSFTLQKSYFPYSVQNRKITLTGLQLYSDTLSPASPAVDLSGLPAASTALNGTTQQTTLNIAADTVALIKGAAQVYLVLRYTAGA